MLPRPEQFDDWRAWARELIRRENQTSLAKRLAEIIEQGSDITFVYNPSKNTITLNVTALGVTDLGYTASTRLLTSSNGADVTLPLVTSTDAGLAPASGGGTTNFLRADGTWTAPSAGNTNLTYTASTRLLESSTGTDVTLPLVSSADAGLAPGSGGGTTNFLRADGTWAVPPGSGGGLADGDYGDITVSAGATVWTIDNSAVTLAKIQNIATARILGRDTAGSGVVEELTGTEATALLDAFTSSLKGLAPASGGGTSNFLRADGTWAAPGAAVTKVTRSTNLTANSWTVVGWDQEVFDDASCHDNSTNNSRLTVPSGYTRARLIGYAVWGNTTGNARYISIEKNAGGTQGSGTGICGAINAGNNESLMHADSGWISVSAGDYFEMFVTENNAASVQLQGLLSSTFAGPSFFQIELLP